MTLDQLGYLATWVVIAGGIGAIIGSTKGRRAEGAVLGTLLGFIGWIIVALFEPSAKEKARRHHEAARAAAIAPQTLYQASAPIRDQAALRPCPWCAELIQPAAVVCRFCGRDVPAVNPPPPAPVPARRAEQPEKTYIGVTIMTSLLTVAALGGLAYFIVTR